MTKRTLRGSLLLSVALLPCAVLAQGAGGASKR